MNPDSERIRNKLKQSKGPSAPNQILPEIQLIRSVFQGNPLEVENYYSSSSEEEAEPINAPKSAAKKSTDDILQLANQALAERGKPVLGTGGPKRGVGMPPQNFQY